MTLHPPADLLAALRLLVPTKTVKLSGIDVEAKRQELRCYFHQTFSLYHRLFALIRSDTSYYERHEPLRHPLIFYFGHTATFYINKLIAGRYLSERLDPRLEAMMAVGVDEMSWDDLDTRNYDWPSVDTVRAYRSKVQECVDRFISEMPLTLPIRQEDPAWLILMGIEHERIHLETSSVILRQMPCHELRSGDELDPEEQALWRVCQDVGSTSPNSWVSMPSQRVVLGKTPEDDTYGWDNEYGSQEVALAAFEASKMLISNGEFLDFVNDGGYQTPSYWTQEGQGWLAFSRAQHPKFWRRTEDGYVQRNLLTEISLPLSWPVEVNCLEAEAFCAWKRSKTGEMVQLPSEAQWYALRALLPTDQPNWERAPGNINLEFGASSVPVDRHEHAGFCDIVGNVWQWTSTPIMPFRGFAVHPLYDDFSVPTFDGRHNLMKGGSWISTGNEALRSARYAFRRHFFQHAGFRIVKTEFAEQAMTEGAKLYETDHSVTQYLEFHYGTPRLGVENFPEQCVSLVMPHVNPASRARCLDIGCSVGRSSFALARHFEEVDAIDFSARFIQAGVRLQKGEEIYYDIPTEGELTLSCATSLERLGLTEQSHRVRFLQGDACNLKPQFNNYDLVFAGNLIDRLYNPTLFLEDITKRIVSGGVLALTSPYTWLEEYTPKERWLGGRREAGEPVSSFDALKRLLQENFVLCHRQDVPFVIRETARKHQYTLAELSVWRRR